MRARTIAAAVWSLVVVLLLVGAVLGFLYVRGGGPSPSWVSWAKPSVLAPYGPSDAPEVVLRSLRLSGFRNVAVGVNGDDVLVRLDVPEVRVPSDVSLSWQAGFAAASHAYPEAKRITVQLFQGEVPLLQVAAPGDRVRAAVKADDPVALRKDASFAYGAQGQGGSAFASPRPHWWSYVAAGASGHVVRSAASASSAEREAAMAFASATSAGFVPLPPGTLVLAVQVSPAALDTKNHAARLLGIRGVQGTARDFADRWNRARAEGQTWEPRVPTEILTGMPEGTAEDALVQQVAKRSGVANADVFVANPSVDLKTGYLVARAVALEDRRGSVVGLVDSLAKAVRTSPLSFRSPRFGQPYLR